MQVFRREDTQAIEHQSVIPSCERRRHRCSLIGAKPAGYLHQRGVFGAVQATVLGRVAKGVDKEVDGICWGRFRIHQVGQPVWVP